MKVKFLPQDIEVEIQPGQSVLHAAQDNGVYIKSVCKGVPSCAECRVRILDGENNVLPPGSEELSLIGTGHFIDRRRLSCQLKCFGNIVVDMTEQIAKQQGLITGQKKKKLAIKDDRIEDARAIRAGDPISDSSGEPGSESGLEESIEDAGESDDKASVQRPRPQPRPEVRPTVGGTGVSSPRNQQPRPQMSQARPRPDSAMGEGGAPGAGGDRPRGGGGGRRRRRRGGGGGNGSGPSGN